MILDIIMSFLAIVSLLLLVALVRTIYIRGKARGKLVHPYPVSSGKTPLEAAQHLSQATTFETVASSGPSFASFHRFLESTYPLTFSSLTREYSDTNNLVFIYKGKDQSLLPGLLCAHQDVVPATIEGWIHPPFSGNIEDGYIYGRGSFDDKGSLIAILEAIEQLLSEGFIPKRTWYIAFGCDEETRGEKGASLIVQRMVKENIRFSVVLDEGGAVVKGFFKAIEKPIAAVGVAEKGNAHVQLEAIVEGGHSSTPRNPTSVGVLAKEIAYIEYHQNRTKLIFPIKKMLYTLGEHAPFSFAFILLNSWLFKPIIFSIFKKNTTMNALIRSTSTVTMTQGSEAANIVPSKATAVLNIRTLPEDSASSIIQRYKRSNISYKILYESPSSRIGSTETPSFNHLERAITSVFPKTIVTPYVMTGGSDALHYERLCDNVYRFTPAVMNNDELSRMHNANERFSIENLSSAISFYKTFITQDSF
ncbi:MAG: M20/M25/M40 family metallo-hydrolase [Spirochaetia bacterium]|nr:M20/M25/M40 family metallo-hydrolase [Spirochaetia bacterium]